MEPEPSKNSERNGYSQRRISSILKAPRKSARFSETEQQENVVECAKPVEKRNSRRVSFAPANDVLLFSKDVRSSSPARNPFQEIITAATTTQKRGATDDGSQQIVGMESLLSAPLHEFQQKDKDCFDSEANFGERTEIFSNQEAFMDMTHSHTINIANDPDLPRELSLQSCTVFPPSMNNDGMPFLGSCSSEKTPSHSANTLSGSLFVGRNVDLSVERKTTPPLLPCVDPSFENFLASLSKPSSSCVNPVDTRPCSEEDSSSLAPIKTQKDYFGKENQAPGSSAHMTRTPSSRLKTEELPATLCTEDPINMDTTEAQAGLGAGDDADPFQWLFPSQDMYTLADKGPAESDKEKPSSRTEQKDKFFRINPPPHQKHAEKDLCSEKTLVFSPGEAYMDITQSHTVNLACGSLASEQSPSKGPYQGFTNTAESHPRGKPANALPAACSKTASLTPSSLLHIEASQLSVSKEDFGPNSRRTFREMSDKTDIFLQKDMSVDMPETLIGRAVMSAEMPPQHLNPKQSQKLQNGDATHPRSRDTPWAFHSDGMETSLKTISKLNVLPDNCLPLANCEPDLDYAGKTVRFTASDGCMDVTQSHTVNIIGGLQLPSHPNMDKAAMGVAQNSQNFNLQTFGDKTVRFSTDDAAMEVTKCHTVNIAADFHIQSFNNADILSPYGEKTVRFNVDDATVDVTKSHTVNIATEVPQDSQNTEPLPAHGERTVRFTMEAADMDVTKCCTVNIATDLNMQLQAKVETPATLGEKTVRFSADDASMDVTKSLTVNIARHFQSNSKNSERILGHEEKAGGFPIDEAAGDVTQSHTGIIASVSSDNVSFVPTHGEKSERFCADDVAMDVTLCHTVNIASDLNMQLQQNPELLPIYGEKVEGLIPGDAAQDVTGSSAERAPSPLQNVDPPPACKNRTMLVTAQDEVDASTSGAVGVDTCERRISKTTPHLLTSADGTIHFTACDAGMDVTQCLTANVSCNFAADRASQPGHTLSSHRDADISCVAKDTENDKRSPDEDEVSPVCDLDGELSQVAQCREANTKDLDIPSQSEVAKLPSLGVVELTKNTKTDIQAMDVAVVQTEQILEDECNIEIPQCSSSAQSLDPQQSKETQLASQRSVAAPLPSSPGIKHRSGTASDPVEREDPGPGVTAPTSVFDKEVCSLKSRRRSLADLQSKVRRLSHIINTAPEAGPTDSPHSHQELDPKSKDGLTSPVKLPPNEPENTETNTQQQRPSAAVQPPALTAAPFSLKTKRLMSSLSVGGFKPKLPRRSKPEDAKKSKSETTKTIALDVSKQQSNFDANVSDIFDEELGSCEDMSETLHTHSPQRTTEEDYPPLEFIFNRGAAHDDVDSVFEEPEAAQRPKRSLPDDENVTSCEKRLKESKEMSEELESEGNSTAGGRTTQTLNSSSTSHTASAFKHSLFESQLEDYASDMQKKLEDGSITVLEFFKLCNIDFVIHNPRQSIRPGTAWSCSEATSMDLLKDKHIGRPKQMIYETDVVNLTEKVEKLKVRMGDLNKLLKTVNKPLWEDIRYSSEKEIKAFGAKLKERNNFFRKTSKVQSHEMKEVLYSNLVQAHLEEQQELRGTIGKADEMIKTLGDCISQVEKELAAIEGKGFENKPSLESLQEEMRKVSEASAENERQTFEVEALKRQSSSQLKKLKVETSSLSRHMDTLSMLIEWNFKERTEDRTVYSFLHETMNLQLTYEKSTGTVTDASSDTERKIANIDFKLELDDEKSQPHARLVHRLVSQYIQGQPDWVKEYPTSRHVPTLLHDISLVVSHCRLLGEECRRLKSWGSLPFDILDISCVDAQVRVVFSSLRKFSKFEVVFGVSLVKHLYVLRVESFKRMIGNATIDQVEEIVASFTPARNVLTETVKKIHQTLLRAPAAPHV